MPEQRPAPDEPSDAILTVPNVVTLCRLLLMPVFVWLALGPENDAAAWAVGFVMAGSDYVDGFLARRLHQVSKLGMAMDPLLDRIVIAAAGVVVIGRGLVPWPAVAAVVVRDVLLLVAVPFLSARGVERPPVNTLGKRATFALMWSFGLFLAVTVPDPPAEWLLPVAWSLYSVGIVLSYLAAFGYARTVARGLRSDVPGG